VKSNLNSYFNPLAFAALSCDANNKQVSATNICAIAPDGTVTSGTPWGNSGVGIVFGPGQFNFDASMSKTNRVGGIHENAQLQFRAEFFNVFNHAQFNAPAEGFNNLGNFGSITGTSVNPRLIQLALKYIF